jgi:hypothetical protein
LQTEGLACLAIADRLFCYKAAVVYQYYWENQIAVCVLLAILIKYLING